MNTYEFWNDMDKIYDAIVAYQEKTIEFNKQFINPWVKLGNVFDKNESNEEIIAHKNAIEIDPKNAQNWYELARTYTRSGDFEKSIQAYQKTINLGFESGELCKNLALAYVMTAKHQDAIPVFQKALDLLENDKDKAVVWNHLGNVYRKLDNYEMALQAFQQADQFETGKAPIVDESPVAALDEEITEELTEEVVVDVEEASAPQLIEKLAALMDPAPEESAPDEDEDAALNDLESDESVAEQSEEDPESAQAVPAADEPELPVAEEDKADEEDFEFDDDDMPVVLEVDFSEEMISDEIEEAVSEKKPVTKVMAASEQDEMPAPAEATQEESEAEDAAPEEEPVAEAAEEVAPEEAPIAEFLATSEEEDEAPVSVVEAVQEEAEIEESAPEDEPVVEAVAALEEDDVSVSAEATQEESEAEDAAPEEEPVAEAAEEAAPEEAPIAEFLATLEEEDEAPVSAVEAVQEEAETEEAAPEEEPVAEFLATLEEGEVSEESVETSESAEEEIKVSQESDATAPLSAYAEYLEDNDPVSVGLTEGKSDETEIIAMAPAEVEVTNSEVNMELSTDLTIEMDSKNAHVWNELGNVYFNAGSYDDAIAAYSKAIELDTQFAWPYTNLALSYVHKERLADAISLYQRGIELFSNEKDKAVAWNRLGNVYRQMNDYENAIAAYQRADELDPGNIAVTQQSRFSLFGSEKVDQEAEYSV